MYNRLRYFLLLSLLISFPIFGNLIANAGEEESPIVPEQGQDRVIPLAHLRFRVFNSHDNSNNIDRRKRVGPPGPPGSPIASNTPPTFSSPPPPPLSTSLGNPNDVLI